MKNKTFDLGNNETASVGIFDQEDGTFMAMTFSRLKSFKTRKGAEAWLVKACPSIAELVA